LRYFYYDYDYEDDKGSVANTAICLGSMVQLDKFAERLIISVTAQTLILG